MFKGFTAVLQNALTRYNQNSKYLVFCARDLRTSSDRKSPDELKYDIIDEQLKQELGKIIVAGGGTLSNPNAIDFSSE
jgi:hypothetical protein